MREYDVIICGASISGLTLAQILGRQGRRVLLLERQQDFSDAYKGEVLQPEAIATLHSLGMLDALRQTSAVRADHFTLRAPDGGERCDLDYSLLPPPFNYVLIQRFLEIRQALAEVLCPQVEFVRGASALRPLFDASQRVSGVRMTADGKRADVSAMLTVACDGAGSRIRERGGLCVQMTRYDHQFAGFELCDVPLDDLSLAAFASPDGVRLLFPLPGQRARLYAQVPPGSLRKGRPAGLAAWADALSRRVPAFEPLAGPLQASLDTVQVVSMRRHIASQWVRPGLALVGDAAHCVHPLAAQGMRAAIGDARELGEQLAQAEPFSSDQVDAALRCYEEVQRPRQAYISRLSHNIAGLLTERSWAGRQAARLEMSILRSNHRLRHIMVYNMSGTGVHRFSFADRLYQMGVPDPRGSEIPQL